MLSQSQPVFWILMILHCFCSKTTDLHGMEFYRMCSEGCVVTVDTSSNFHVFWCGVLDHRVQILFPYWTSQNPNPLSVSIAQTLLELCQLRAVPSALGSLFCAHCPLVHSLNIHPDPLLMQFHAVALGLSQDFTSCCLFLMLCEWVEKHCECASLYPAPSGENWRNSLAYSPSVFGMRSCSSTLVSLVLSLPHFKSYAPFLCLQNYGNFQVVSPASPTQWCLGHCGTLLLLWLADVPSYLTASVPSPINMGILQPEHQLRSNLRLKQHRLLLKRGINAVFLHLWDTLRNFLRWRRMDSPPAKELWLCGSSSRWICLQKNAWKWIHLHSGQAGIITSWLPGDITLSISIASGALSFYLGKACSSLSMWPTSRSSSAPAAAPYDPFSPVPHSHPSPRPLVSSSLSSEKKVRTGTGAHWVALWMVPSFSLSPGSVREDTEVAVPWQRQKTWVCTGRRAEFRHEGLFQLLLHDLFRDWTINNLKEQYKKIKKEN